MLEHPGSPISGDDGATVGEYNYQLYEYI